ncbi:hypothetical protein pb186bvf_015274 [Paramecium bursaria]
MIRKFKKLKMKQQALILQGSIILLVLLFVSIFIVPISSHGLKIIKKSSHEALIRSNDARVSLMSDKISTLISQAFLQANLTLNKAQQLYLTSINSSYNITSSYKKKVERGYLLAYQQPYNMEQIDPTSDYCQKFGNLIQLIDSYLLSFSLEQSSNIQIIYRIQQPHLTSIFSPITLFSTYDVEQKSYYTEHLLQNNTRIIGSPFISSTTSKVSFMITQTFHNQQNSKEMIMAIGFQFDNLSQYLTLNNIKFVLCTVTGIIVSEPIKQIKYYYYLQSEQLQRNNMLAYLSKSILLSSVLGLSTQKYKYIFFLFNMLFLFNNLQNIIIYKSVQIYFFMIMSQRQMAKQYKVEEKLYENHKSRTQI